MATTSVYLVLGSILCFYAFLRLLLHFTQDATEPPVIETSIPFISPILGMIQQKSQYHIRLRSAIKHPKTLSPCLPATHRDAHRLPIYTLRLPFSRMYIVNATDLIPSLQKHWRTVSFAAIAANAGHSVGLSKKAVKLMHDALTSEDGFSLSWPKYVMSAMSPGNDLDSMNRVAIETFANQTETLRTSATVKVGLWQWTRQTMVMATTEAVWGPQNPWRDPAVAEAWE